jgi:Tol biopolymer transport system component
MGILHMSENLPINSHTSRLPVESGPTPSCGFKTFSGRYFRRQAISAASAAVSLLCGGGALAQEQQVDGYAGATSSYAEDKSDYSRWDTSYESELLPTTHQLITDSKRSGEGYFSADGTQFIFQSEVEGNNPFYQIFLRDLDSGEIRRVSPGIGLTTCSWVHPTLDRVMFSSTHEDPEARTKMAEEIAIRASGVDRPYGWDYDPHYEIYQADADGSNLVNLTNSPGYDAEGSYSADGSKILFASNREAYTRTLSLAEQELLADDASYFMDLYIMDADGSNVQQLTFSPGYDGGPFFSPDNESIIWRRFNPDGNSAEIWTMRLDGSEARQLTADSMVAWGPYFHPSGDYIIYSSNVLGHANFELFMVDTEGLREPVRVTNTAGTDILPVFSPDGRSLAWSTTRTPDGTSQIHMSDWNHERALELLGLD